MAASEIPWWKDAVVYQIYPASFKDSNGDGTGDLRGILQKMDHLKDLGVDIIWISPMFKSPNVDMGYDIPDYEAVDETYGTMQDMQDLIDASHRRGMRLILDLVVNHTSDQHAWFQESRSSRDSPKRDWYIWKPPRYAEDGSRMPPTNWRSHFGGSVWEWDENTKEYYLHLFAPEQPDLNWENEETREAIYDSAMRFWLDKGIDGFRIDVVNMYSKGLEYQDAPIVDKDAVEQPGWMFYCNGPRMHEFLREMNEEVLNKYDAVTIGETPATPDPQQVLKYVGLGDKQLSMVFQFDIVDLGQGESQKYHARDWKLPELKGIIMKWQQFIDGTDGWTTVFCENHDQGRSVSRYASDEPRFRAHSAKLLAMMMCSLTGTLFIYQGQEIGMVNVPEEWRLEEYSKDIEAINFYDSIAKDPKSSQKDLDDAMKAIQIHGRDNARLPMQWDDSAFAGFTECKTGGWMRTHDAYTEINVAKQERETDSVLSFWKSMIKLRKQHGHIFTHGKFEGFDMDNEQTFMFAKRSGQDVAVVALNFTSEDQLITLPYDGLYPAVGTYADVAMSDGFRTNRQATKLRPWEGRLYLSFETS